MKPHLQRQRATGSSVSYSFGYNSDQPVPHLTSITNTLGTTESYTFSYGSTTLTPPFGSGPFGNATLLQGITITGPNTSWALEYVAGTGEVSSVTNPSGGLLQWQYRTYTYSASGFTYREVANRQMQATSTGTRYTWNVTNDSNPSLHATATVADLGAGTQKTWNFGAASGSFPGLATRYQEFDTNRAILLQKDYTWTQDSAGNVYIGSTISTLNPGMTYAAQTKTTQTLDTYGNVTQSQVYDYGNLNSPARTYTYTYLTSYSSLYIRNRLASATVFGNGQNITLVQSGVRRE